MLRQQILDNQTKFLGQNTQSIPNTLTNSITGQYVSPENFHHSQFENFSKPLSIATDPSPSNFQLHHKLPVLQTPIPISTTPTTAQFDANYEQQKMLQFAQMYSQHHPNTLDHQGLLKIQPNYAQLEKYYSDLNNNLLIQEQEKSKRKLLDQERYFKEQLRLQQSLFGQNQEAEVNAAISEHIIKKKRPRDPNEPKKPPTAFFLYMKGNRETIKEGYPDIKVTNIAKVAGDQWRNMNKEERQFYVDLHSKLKQVYAQQLSAFRSGQVYEGPSFDDVLPEKYRKTEKQPRVKKRKMDNSVTMQIISKILTNFFITKS